MFIKDAADDGNTFGNDNNENKDKKKIMITTIIVNGVLEGSICND